LDAKCVRCHGGAQGMAAGLDLSRGWTEFFNISYEHLTARREKMYTADLIAGICAMNGTAYWSCKVFDPYTHGSGKAPLADILLKPPHKDWLTRQERETLFAWMDSNGMYFGTWDYTAAGPTSKPYLHAVARVKEVMKEAGCVNCHATDQGAIKRFDQWINLDAPEMSRVLRAPLPAGVTAESGYGLALCRARKVDQNFSRKGLLYGFGYAHGVMDLDKFPTQTWPTVWPAEGQPVTPFASVNDPNYQKMLGIIRAERSAQLANPRVDMPDADLVGGGIHAGRPRQILPQTLPEPLPQIHAALDPNGFVRLGWESSARMIGLIAEIHRGADAAFMPGAATRIARTELFGYCDTNPPPGQVHYAVVFVSDPAETCGTCKSGAVLDYQHDPKPGGMPALPGERCPLSTFVAQRSVPVRVSVEVPELLPALRVSRPDATPGGGTVSLRWPAAGVPGVTTYDVFGRHSGQTEAPCKLNRAPLRTAEFSDMAFHNGQEASYVVVACAPRHADPGVPPDDAWVSARPLPVRVAPTFVLTAAADGIQLRGGARFDGNVLQFPEGGYAAVNPTPERLMDGPGPFSFVVEVCVATPGQMPVLLGFGQFNGAGWFLQKLGGQWRFHLSGVSCDGGQVPLGQWVKVVGVYDGQMARLYQNGQLVAEAAVPASPALYNQELYLGQYTAQNDKPYQFNGKIREFALYRRVLNAEGK